MQIALDVVEGPHRGRRFTFDRHDSFIVGRARCAHFRLPKKDLYFSRVHFIVEVNPPHCRLVDTGSSNGTYVNGELVRAADLHNGDLIRGGHTVLKVSFIDAPVAKTLSSPESVPTTAARNVDIEATEPHNPGTIDASNETGPAAMEPCPVLPDIPGFTIQEEIGCGGMGVVYRAQRGSDGQEVAIKTLRPVVTGSEREIQRFLREARILRELRHPNIVTFHEMGNAGDLLYFVMDYVPGIDASRLLRRDGPLAIGRAVGLICQVLEALDYAHNQGFVHRDVKPANLLVTGEPGFETCSLADFGLARAYQASPLSGLTILGDVGGTVPYMSPEQITNFQETTPASDQYSIAATLYRLLSGCYLFDFEDVPCEHRLRKILMDEPVPIQSRRADIPKGLVDAIHRALAKDPSSRFANAITFRDALLPFGDSS